MTVSYFEALETRIPMTAAERMMDAAQAALYPHLTKEAAQRMWNGWRSQARGPEPVVRGRRGAGGQPTPLFTFNGVAMSPDALSEKLAGSLGDRLTA